MIIIQVEEKILIQIFISKNISSEVKVFKKGKSSYISEITK